ncbi:NAD-dependent epimerase/dehydratase family protein [Cryobacterium sp. TMT3-29-2]|uniref:NAD-dependent epimerase/dehydratase family protein n=1 Tax=Cryobacterium sp. TMT3-29-2 TaxID=2555867 RepID=UPI001F54530F|nr:NAD-dependent epimerase/dehydratase family protein [Cryobacterium sp. TMT3-29-2]
MSALAASLRPWTFDFIVIVGAGAAVAILGLVEDIRGVRIVTRASVQLAVGAVATTALVWHSDSELWWIPVGAVVLAGYTNAANFMDGINGISGLHGAVVGSAFGVIGILTERPWLLGAGLVLAVSFVAFLPWNLAGKRMFLGDVGSYLLGGSVGIIAITALVDGVAPLAVVAPLCIYLADTAVTLVRRVLGGEEWHQAHRSHVYQRLTAAGFTHLTAALIVTASTLCTSAIGLLSLDGSGALTAVAAVGIGLVAAVYLSLPGLLSARGRKPETSDTSSPRKTPEAPGPSHSAPARWAVVGGTGFIGSALIEELQSRGFRAESLTAPRLRLAANATPEEALSLLKDHSQAIATLSASMLRADVVVNAAGLASPGAAASEALFGANALLPAVIYQAANLAGVQRLIHLSSAAVQGRRMVLDETPATEPFSPYSKSKALGEALLLAGVGDAGHGESPEIVILRATSVQGPGRATTGRLRRLAQSAAASVAMPGDRPTVVSSVRGLVTFVARVGAHQDRVPTIVLQPWEGMTTSSVLELAGGRAPRRLPLTLCRALIGIGYSVGTVAPPVRGLVRRVELMWLGQDQNAAWARSVGLEGNSYLTDVFGVLPERVK